MEVYHFIHWMLWRWADGGEVFDAIYCDWTNGLTIFSHNLVSGITAFEKLLKGNSVRRGTPWILCWITTKIGTFHRRIMSFGRLFSVTAILLEFFIVCFKIENMWLLLFKMYRSWWNRSYRLRLIDGVTVNGCYTVVIWSTHFAGK